MACRTAVYKHFHAGDVLAYVGCSKNPDARHDQHLASSPWFLDVVRTEVTWFPSRKEALAAEAAAIAAEKPLFNKVHKAKDAEPAISQGWFRLGLKAQIDACDTTVAEISRKTGVSRDVINKLPAREGASTTVENAVALAAFFGAQVEDFKPTP